MTIRELFTAYRTQDARWARILGAVRSACDLFMPGALDKQVEGKVIRGTGRVVLFMDGKPAGEITCEVMDYVEGIDTSGVADRGGTAAGPADLAGKVSV